MADIVTPEVRSRMMSGIHGKNTKPELFLRKSLFAKGFRYRLHNTRLAGKPDIVLSKYNAVIFVQGCFWHGHENCSLFSLPKSREEFWINKIEGNRTRDARNIKQLLDNGWRVLLVWECSVKGKGKLDKESLLDLIISWIKRDEKYLDIRGFPPIPIIHS